MQHIFQMFSYCHLNIPGLLRQIIMIYHSLIYQLFDLIPSEWVYLNDMINKCEQAFLTEKILSYLKLGLQFLKTADLCACSLQAVTNQLGVVI